MGLKQTADSLIKKFGADVTIIRITEGNNVDGEYVTLTAEINIKAYISSFEKFEIDNTNVKADDLKLITVSPVINSDKIKYADDTYNVINIKKTLLQAETIINEVQIRK